MRFSAAFKRALLRLCMPLRRLQGHPSPQIEELPIYIDGLPEAFEGYRIAVIADLHLPYSLSAPQQVLTAVRETQPDHIFIAGDLANRYTQFDRDGIAAFVSALTAIAPCVAVLGNHECGAHRESYRAVMREAGVPLPENATVVLQKNGQALPLYGVGYPPRVTEITSPALLLLHHPEAAAAFVGKGFSLAVCGHAHGGQLRLGGRGLYAPGQGFFPRYVSGLYTVGELSLAVSRGLGDSSLPLRWRNPPHIPILLLHRR